MSTPAPKRSRARRLTDTAAALGIAAALGATLALPPGALAQANYCRWGFQQADDDNDGKVSPAEADTLSRAQFANIDANGDGALAESEFMACMSEALPPADAAGEEHAALRDDASFTEADADGSGGVDRAEFLAGAEAAFRAAQDETADPEAGAERLRQLRRYVLFLAASPDAAAEGTEGASESSGMLRPDEIAGGASHSFTYLDRDDDEALTAEEWSASDLDGVIGEERIVARFGRLDADGDGNVTLEEYAQAQSAGRDAGREEAGEDDLPVFLFYRFVR